GTPSTARATTTTTAMPTYRMVLAVFSFFACFAAIWRAFSRALFRLSSAELFFAIVPHVGSSDIDAAGGPDGSGRLPRPDGTTVPKRAQHRLPETFKAQLHGSRQVVEGVDRQRPPGHTRPRLDDHVAEKDEQHGHRQRDEPPHLSACGARNQQP